MRLDRTVALGIAFAAAGLLAPGAHADAAKGKQGVEVTCQIRSLVQSFPTASAPGEDFAFVNCSGPFGEGVHYDTFTLSPETATTGTAELHFKSYFDRGTVSGVWRATYEFTSPTSAVFDQSVEWTSGTGAFRHVRGTGSGTGILNGTIGEVTQTITVTGVPRGRRG